MVRELEHVSKLRKIHIDQMQKYLFPISKQKVFPEFGTPPDDTVMRYTGKQLEWPEQGGGINGTMPITAYQKSLFKTKSIQKVSKIANRCVERASNSPRM